MLDFQVPTHNIAIDGEVKHVKSSLSQEDAFVAVMTENGALYVFEFEL